MHDDMRAVVAVPYGTLCSVRSTLSDLVIHVSAITHQSNRGRQYREIMMFIIIISFYIDFKIGTRAPNIAYHSVEHLVMA